MRLTAHGRGGSRVETTIPGVEDPAAGAGQTLRDYARLRAEVADCLDDLARVNEDAAQPARATRAREVRDGLLDQRFTLLVLGEFKRGKSTLINRLLGMEALPVGAAPTT